MSLTMPAPAIPEGRKVVRAGDPVAAVAEMLRRRGLDPARADHPEDRSDSTDEYQRDVFRQAWVNSLALSGHGDYARYRLPALDGEQFPDHLRRYVEELAKTRQHNRDQLKVPEAQRNIARPSIQHLIAHGSVGSGKTVAAAAAGAFAVECGLMARFVSHSMYLSWLQPNNAPAGLTPVSVRERYERCDLLILDDLCNEMDEYATNHVRTHTSNLITARLNSGRATLFTTNLSFDQVAAVLGDRLASRVGQRAVVLRMVGNDRRKPQMW
ncbi:ATP-binding protein [Streptomyces rimosus]|uniref:ATP-binding protein n=1 Tax=Streptomyces rimosus TaxID=1927 RepID=UPI0004BED22F|nr:ATP-binding protein [Streptomyces rimosus]